MRFHGLLTLLLSGTVLLPHGVAAASNYTISDLLPLIPTCALPCILQGLSAAPNALSDPTTSCANTTLQAPISVCIQGACNYTEQARIGILNSKLCAGVPHDESHVNAILIVSGILGPLALIAIALRTYSRYAITQQMGGDDWTMLTAGVILTAVLGLNFHNVIGNGFGKHYWNLDVTKVTSLLKIFFAAEILYVVVITLVKVSIIQFYLRVFPTKWFKIANIVTMTLVIAAGIGAFFPIFFQCSPVMGAWDRLIQSKCININLLAYAVGGIGVGFDMIILLLPIPELLKLKMSRRKKSNVLFMFSLGGIACITSMVRLKYLAEFEKSTDPTWDNAIPVIVSLIEICVAIICACLPALRALISHFLPRFANDSPTASNNQPNNSESYTAKDTIGSKSPATCMSDQQSHHPGSLSPRSESGVNEKSNAFDSSSSLANGRGSWFRKGNYITRDREVIQDIERGSIIVDYDGVKPTGLTKKNTTTITTKIWTEHSPPPHTHQAHHRLHPLSSNSVDHAGSPRYNHHTSRFSFHPTNSSDESFHHLTGIAQTTSHDESRPDTGAFIGRSGSEDSIFVLEGPRESDNDDDRRIMNQPQRGRNSTARAFERSGDGEIELQRFSSGGRPSGVLSASVRSRSESRGLRTAERRSCSSHSQGQNHSRGMSLADDDMDVFGRRKGSSEGKGYGRKAGQAPVSVFNRNPPPTSPPP